MDISCFFVQIKLISERLFLVQNFCSNPYAVLSKNSLDVLITRLSKYSRFTVVFADFVDSKSVSEKSSDNVAERNISTDCIDNPRYHRIVSNDYMF